MLEATGVSDESPQAGEQQLPMLGADETDAKNSCSPNRLELAAEQSRSEGGHKSDERRWG
jgi:hypothetical protein